MIRRIERGMAIAAAAALLLLVVVVLIDVIGRNAFNRPLASGTELTEMLMGALAFLSFPLLTYRQRDITVDLFDMLAGRRLNKLQVAVSGIVAATVFGLLAWQAAVQGLRAAANGESTPQLHVSLAYIWWGMGALSVVTALSALVVAIAVFTRHPVLPVPLSELE